MDAGDLTVFAAAAKAGGITKAAETLHTVQSNVTQRIRRLEVELGVPLFNRHSRGVTLTSAGTQLLPYAERIGRLLHEAKQAAADGPTARGRIVIGALESATAVRLPPVLAAYGVACPEVDIEIDTGTTAALVDAVLARRLEAAFVAGAVSHPELLAIPMVEEELVMATAPWIRALDRLTAAPLKLIVFRTGCSYRTRLEALLAERGISNARRLEFGTLDGIIGCVGAGIGVTLLPRIVVARAASEGRIALHRLPREAARIETVLIRRHDVFVSTALARFIEIASARLANPAGVGPARTRRGPALRAVKPRKK
ncbi:MAG TPA: LysR family transcriptional regulator [Stellaceae bacterium]|nr:LysR family transcriptional regulator [Stellaceae bacterium]